MKTTSLVSLARIPSLFSFLPGRMPGVPFGTMKAEMPRLPRARSVTAMTTITPPMLPCVMKVLAPLITQRVAVAHRDRARAGGVAAGGRLGQAPGAEHLAARERPRKRSRLRVGAEHEDVRGAEPVVRGDAQAPPPGSTRASSSMQMQ